MILPASDLVLPCVDNAQEADDIYNRSTDVCLNTENLDDTEFLYLENPKVLVKKASLQKEKQISVDPISLKDSANQHLLLPPIVTATKVASLPPLLLPVKPKFLSTSLPGSATSSPRFGSGMLKKKWKKNSQVSSLSINPLYRQHSGSLNHLAQHRESDFRRSKSYGEGRGCAPSDDFDLWPTKVNGTGHDQDTRCSSFCRTEVRTNGLKHGEDMDHPNEEKFKCGALCLFLPGFGKGKPVRARKEGAEMAHVISRTVSLEKFECGSWTSSAIINGEDGGDSTNRYFDLPLELIRSSVNEAHSPVRTAFVFDKDLKGVLKNGRSGAMPRKSQESPPRRVHFSSSSPTSHPTSPASCITPRLRKAREDFNAFLEAQSA